MRRGSANRQDGLGHDSFLDIVTNIVGIMIILIAIAGLRVQKHSRDAAATESGASRAELDAALAEEESLKGEMLRLKQQMELLRREVAVRSEERDILLTQLALAQRNLTTAESSEQATGDRVHELERQLTDLDRQLDDLRDRQELLAEHRDAPEVVETLPSPIATTVSGKEAHFQLRNGRVAHIPLDELVELFKQDALKRIGQTRSRGTLTETVGPLDGFRLSYTLLQDEAKSDFGVVASVVRLDKWRLLPVSNFQGETVDEALAPYSNFRRSLAAYRPDTTITIWTYPESFAEFRQLKRELYAKGYDTAARPLPDGYPISGSPMGSRSSAQ